METSTTDPEHYQQSARPRDCGAVVDCCDPFELGEQPRFMTIHRTVNDKQRLGMVDNGEHDGQLLIGNIKLRLDDTGEPWVMMVHGQMDHD